MGEKNEMGGENCEASDLGARRSAGRWAPASRVRPAPSEMIFQRSDFGVYADVVHLSLISKTPGCLQAFARPHNPDRATARCGPGCKRVR